MNKFRVWLINFLIGDASYIRNCVINGKVVLRKDHNVNSCVFTNGGYVEVEGLRFPPE